jgi:hypothetical protein
LQYWARLDPLIILDCEKYIDYMIINAEAGTMLDKFFSTKSHSANKRLAIGVGNG